MKYFLIITLALQLASANMFEEIRDIINIYEIEDTEGVQVTTEIGETTKIGESWILKSTTQKVETGENKEIDDIKEFKIDKNGSCKYFTELNDKTIWPWPNKKVANCDFLPNPVDVPADTEVLYIIWGKNLTTLKEDAFISYEKLIYVYVEEGTLEQIDKHAFRNMTTTVTAISFWHNLLTEIPTGLFAYAPNVVTIGLNENKLRVLQTNLFSNLKFLKTIKLNNNEITLIEENCFVNLPSLEELYLYNNKMHTLSFSIMDNMNSLQHLPLDGNPWNCNEALCKFMDFVNKRQLWRDRRVPTCNAPGDLRGKKWNRIQQYMGLSFTPNFLSVFEKDNFTLECKHCFASKLRWKLNGRQQPINYQQISEDSLTSKLTIENVHKNQQGEYRCYVKNCEDCDVAGLYVEVKEEPHQKFDWNAVHQNFNSNEMTQGYLILKPNVVNKLEDNKLSNKVNVKENVLPTLTTS